VGSLDDLVRGAVATLESVTSTGGLQVTVSHRAYVAQDALGDGEPYATAVPRTGIYSDRKQQYHSADGTEIQTQSRIVFLGNIPMSANDLITLPDGTSPPILEVKGPLNRTGGRYLTIVVFGQALRAQRSI
jgi:hypothetical protein